MFGDAPCGGIIPPHPLAIALFLPATYFVKELRRKILLAGELFPHTPKLLRAVKDKLLHGMLNNSQPPA